MYAQTLTVLTQKETDAFVALVTYDHGISLVILIQYTSRASREIRVLHLEESTTYKNG